MFYLLFNIVIMVISAIEIKEFRISLTLNKFILEKLFKIRCRMLNTNW